MESCQQKWNEFDGSFVIHYQGKHQITIHDELLCMLMIWEMFTGRYKVAVICTSTSRALMEGINIEKSSQGCYEAMQLSQ